MLTNQEIETICASLQQKADEGLLQGMIDIPIEVYHHPKCPGISKTDASVLLESTFQEYRRRKTIALKYHNATPEEIEADEDLMEFKKSLEKFKHGRAVHTMCLEPHKFDQEFIQEFDDSQKPSPISRKKDDLAMYEIQLDIWERDHVVPWQEKAIGKTVLKEKDYKKAKKVSEMVLAHPTFQAIMKDAVVEQTIFFYKDGVLWKTRPDILNSKLKLCPDLKTSQDISTNEFQRSITSYYYDLQGAIQLEGVKAVTGEDYMFGFFAAEMHDCRPLRLDDASLEAGRELMKIAGERYKTGIEREKQGLKTGYSLDFEIIGNAPWGFNIDSRS
jgi:hypothetical protein